MVILGIGSNLASNFGDRYANIKLALSQLEGYGIQILKKSSFYETLAYPNNEDPKFINIAILVKTKLPPVDLMSVLLFIEEKLGRKRIKKNSPRTCDIDIIDYERQILNFDYKNLNLIIPHPNLSSRNFVLFPLKEILPEWTHPKTKDNIDALIKKLSEADKKSILKIEKN